ncbi:ribosomal maturation YjgA family protein [Lysinibacillus xylanilyticus]|uniref:ribosomal maturation YjgA family protein n=1 Tax=Lysinibacillus xylanilyticus TaxID=582475 RepID=UPI00382D4283
MILLTNEHKPSNLQYRNMRIAYLISIVITIILGLFSRKWSILLPAFVAQNAGDMLWAMMVYFEFRLLLVRKSTLTAVWLSFLFSFGIEFSQLYQEDWINQIRGTTLGALILGKGFLIEDLVRYTVGIIIATVLDKVTFKFPFRS